MSTLQLYRSDNQFARNVFKMHGCAPIDLMLDAAGRAATKHNPKRRFRYDPYGSGHDFSDLFDMNREEAEAKSDDEYLAEVFRLRNQVFHEMLKWQVVSYSGLEVDRYDLMNPWYITIENAEKKVVGTWRALPTVGNYMLKDIFPELLRGEELPCDETIWEISRFGVDQLAKEDGTLNEEGCVARLTGDLLKTFHVFAREHDVKAFVAVTSCAAERILKKLGFKVRRMGDGRAMKIGKVWCTAIWIDCEDLRRQAEGEV